MFNVNKKEEEKEERNKNRERERERERKIKKTEGCMIYTERKIHNTHICICILCAYSTLYLKNTCNVG